MPNIEAFARRYVRRAREHGIATAAAGASLEVGVWTASRAYSRLRGRAAYDFIWDDDWDVCVVLDATRTDLYREVAPGYDWLPDDPTTGWSPGSCSPEWYGRTFDPAEVPADEQVGIVTANPFALKDPDRFPELAHTPLDANDALDYVDYVFQDSWGCEVGDGEYLDVTHPEVVTNRAYDAWADEDLDRLVVHYMQPHLPFRTRPEWFSPRANLKHFGEPELPKRPDGQPYAHDHKEIWKQVRDGEKDRDAVWAAYRDNLEWALDAVDRLRRAVDGDLLITTDHGNGLGEWGIWSHPTGIEIPALRRVPWVTVAGAGEAFRRVEVVAYDTGDRAVPEAATADHDGLEEKLAALGYTEA